MAGLELELTIASNNEVFDTPDKAAWELSRIFSELAVSLNNTHIQSGVIVLRDLNGNMCGDVDIKYEPVNE